MIELKLWKFFILLLFAMCGAICLLVYVLLRYKKSIANADKTLQEEQPPTPHQF